MISTSSANPFPLAVGESKQSNVAAAESGRRERVISSEIYLAPIGQLSSVSPRPMLLIFAPGVAFSWYFQTTTSGVSSMYLRALWTPADT